MAPLEGLDDSTRDSIGGAWPVCCVDLLLFFTAAMGLYLYPGLDTTPSRTRLQYLFLKINDESSCPYCVPCSNRPFPYIDPRHHAFPNATAFACGTMPLPNDNAFPTAEYLYRMLQRKPFSRMATRSRPQSIFAECSRESPLAEW